MNEPVALAQRRHRRARALSYPFMVTRPRGGHDRRAARRGRGVHGPPPAELRRPHVLRHGVPGATGAALAGLPLALGYYGACAVAAIAMGAGRWGAHPRPSAGVGGDRDRPGRRLRARFLFLSLYRGVVGEPRDAPVRNFLGITGARCWSCSWSRVGVCSRRFGARRPAAPLRNVDPDVPGRAACRSGTRAGFLSSRARGRGDQADHRCAARFALLVAPPAAPSGSPRGWLGLALERWVGCAVTWLALALSYYPTIRSASTSPRSGSRSTDHVARGDWTDGHVADVCSGVRPQCDLAGTSIALAWGAVGWFVVLRAQVFAGDALSHVAFAGAIVAAVLGVDQRVGLFASAASVRRRMTDSDPRPGRRRRNRGRVRLDSRNRGVIADGLLSSGTGGIRATGAQHAVRVDLHAEPGRPEARGGDRPRSSSPGAISSARCCSQRSRRARGGARRSGQGARRGVPRGAPRSSRPRAPRPSARCCCSG